MDTSYLSGYEQLGASLHLPGECAEYEIYALPAEHNDYRYKLRNLTTNAFIYVGRDEIDCYIRR